MSSKYTKKYFKLVISSPTTIIRGCKVIPLVRHLILFSSMDLSMSPNVLTCNTTVSNESCIDGFHETLFLPVITLGDGNK